MHDTQESDSEQSRLWNGPAGRAVVHLRTPEAIGRRTGFDTAPPYLPGFEPQAGFAF